MNLTVSFCLSINIFHSCMSRPYLCKHPRLCLCSGNEEESHDLPASLWSQRGHWLCVSDPRPLYCCFIASHTLSFTEWLPPVSVPDIVYRRLSGGWSLGPFSRFWPNTRSLWTPQRLLRWSMSLRREEQSRHMLNCSGIKNKS